MMNLSKEQIDQLYAFTEKKHVRYYDLQVELVDHLATRIEEELQADPKMGFEQALQKVYASFGLFGFAHVVQEKENALLKRNRYMWWIEFKQFFTLPKLIITLTIFLAALYIGQFIDPATRFLLVFISYTAFSIYFLATALSRRKTSTKKIMLLNMIPGCSAVAPAILLEHLLIFKQQITNVYVFAGICVLAFILQAAILEVSKKVHRQAEMLFPEAFA